MSLQSDGTARQFWSFNLRGGWRAASQVLVTFKMLSAAPPEERIGAGDGAVRSATTALERALERAFSRLQIARLKEACAQVTSNFKGVHMSLQSDGTAHTSKSRLKAACADEPTLVLLEDPTASEPALQEAVAEPLWGRRPVVLVRPCACGGHHQQTCARQAVGGTDFCPDCCPSYCCCSCTNCEVTLCGVSPDVSPRTTSRAVYVSPRTACIAVLSAKPRTPIIVLTATR